MFKKKKINKGLPYPKPSVQRSSLEPQKSISINLIRLLCTWSRSEPRGRDTCHLLCYLNRHTALSLPRSTAQTWCSGVDLLKEPENWKEPCGEPELHCSSLQPNSAAASTWPWKSKLFSSFLPQFFCLSIKHCDMLRINIAYIIEMPNISFLDLVYLHSHNHSEISI